MTVSIHFTPTRITNFGEDKHFKLVEDTDVDTLNGEYRLPDMVTPISDDSSTVSKSVSQDLTEVDRCQHEAHLIQITMKL